MGIEMVECEDEELYGKEYLQWKKKTLGNQVSDHKYTCDFSSTALAPSSFSRTWASSAASTSTPTSSGRV